MGMKVFFLYESVKLITYDILLFSRRQLIESMSEGDFRGRDGYVLSNELMGMDCFSKRLIELIGLLIDIFFIQGLQLYYIISLRVDIVVHLCWVEKFSIFITQ